MVPSGDHGALAAALGRLLDDPARREDMSVRGRGAVLERYSWPEVAARVEALYGEVLEEKGLAARLPTRSEERRVGKEGRSRWARDPKAKTAATRECTPRRSR